MSQLEVDKIIPQSGTTLTIGDSGDTITFADGAVIGIDTDTLYIDSTNNRVGIGTSSPTELLNVSNLSGNSYIELTASTTGTSQFTFGDSGGSFRGGVKYTHTDDKITLRSNGNDRLIIDNTGNVGIGTSSPDDVLHIVSTDAITILQRTTDVGNNSTLSASTFKNSDSTVSSITNFNKSGSTKNSGADGYEFRLSNFGNGYTSFFNDGSESMRIDSSGNVGIGTSSPSKILDIQGSSSIAHKYTGATDVFLFGQFNSSGDVSLNNQANAILNFATNNLERMRIDSSGRLLVGTTSTTINTSNFGFVFDASTDVLKTSRNVNGASTSAEHFGNAGQIRFMGDGDAENTNNSYGALSDRTLKENETPANSQWNDIKALQIKNYNLIEYPDRPQIGVIAQDLEDAGMNGLVKTDDEGLKSVKYSVLYMKAVKALQEALIEIDNLKARVDTLEGN